MSRLAAGTLAIMMLLTARQPMAQPRELQPPPGPEDFALQLPLTVSGNNGVVQFKLPLSVYLQSRMADVADLRLFDAEGAVVPFAWHRPGADRTVTVRQSSVRMFPVHAAPGTQSRALELSVQTSVDGSLISLQTPAAGQSSAQQSRLRALILDIGIAQTGEVLDSIQLLLPPLPERQNYQAVLAIAQSDDLKLWDTLAQTRLDWLSAAPELEKDRHFAEPTSTSRLINDRIAFAGKVSRYLRIEWLEGPPLEFAGVLAHWRATQFAAEAQLELKLQAQHGAGVDGDWLYRSSPAIAATQIGLDLPTVNTVLPVQIGVYRKTASSDPAQRLRFVPHLDTVFYRLLRDGVEQRSSRLTTAPLAASEWVVRPARHGEAAPELVLRWAPHTLVFTARGKAFVLAVGADAKTARRIAGATAIERVAPGYSRDALARLEHASVGPPLAPNRESASLQMQRPPAPAEALAHRRVLILWLALLCGVAVLGWMSWRLFVQMNRSDSGEDDSP